MAAVYSRSDAGTEFSPSSRKRRIYEGNVDFDRIKQESANLEAMGASGSPTTPNGTPLLERLLQLEQHMDGLEQKYSPRGPAADLRSPSSPTSLFSSPSTPSSLQSRCRPAKSVLLETESKGTLVERVQRLEERISQHTMDLEKAFSSGRFSSNRFEPRYGESDHVGEDPEHLESPSQRDSWSKVQENGNSKETYDNNLELQAVFFPMHKSKEFEDILRGTKVPPNPNLISERQGSAEPKQLSEDTATREMHLELEDKASSPLETVDEQTDAIPERSAGANGSFEAETVGKTMNDENAAIKFKFEETPTSETSVQSASIDVPTETEEPVHVDEKDDTGEPMEQSSVKPIGDLVQNEYHIKRDGVLAKDLIHFRSIDEPLGKFENDFVKESSSLPLQEMGEKPNEQSAALLPLIPDTTPEQATQAGPITQKDMRRKQSFKNVRGMIQRFFGHKEADAAVKDTSKPHGVRPTEADTTTKGTSRSHIFHHKEADSATKGSSRPHRFGSTESDSATKGTSRPHRFGSTEADSTTKGTSRLHIFGHKAADAATKSTSRPHRFGSTEVGSAAKGNSRPQRFGSTEADSATKGNSQSQRFGSTEADSATKGTSRPHRFGSAIL